MEKTSFSPFFFSFCRLFRASDLHRDPCPNLGSFFFFFLRIMYAFGKKECGLIYNAKENRKKNPQNSIYISSCLSSPYIIVQSLYLFKRED